MAGEDHPAVGRQIAYQVAHLADLHRVEALGGLVEDQQVGSMDDGLGDAHPLAVAAALESLLMGLRPTS